MKKKFLVLFLSVLTVLTGSVYAEEEIDFSVPVCIMVNEDYIKTDVDVYLHQGVTYVPVRAISEALCAQSVEFYPKEQKVVIKKDDKDICLLIGKNYAFVNDEKTDIFGGIFIKNDRTYVPVRFVSEAFGAEVYWDSSSYTVKIKKEAVEVPASCIKEKTYTEGDLYWLSRIVNAESEGEPEKGMVAVGNVVINRVLSEEYPDTIYGVIFDMKHGVQFQPVLNGTIYNSPSQNSIIAAKIALEGENYVENSLFFLNEDIATNFWIVENRTYFTTIGQHSFYL